MLDPFAGCGTTIEAALMNKRRVIGIDILPFSLRLINYHRITPNGFDPLPIQGVPVDFQTASHLARTDPFKFQDWTISLIDGLAANPQKVGDDGIDGFGMFLNAPDNMERKAIIVQVTGSPVHKKRNTIGCMPMSETRTPRWASLSHSMRKPHNTTGRTPLNRSVWDKQPILLSSVSRFKNTTNTTADGIGFYDSHHSRIHGQVERCNLHFFRYNLQSSVDTSDSS